MHVTFVVFLLSGVFVNVSLVLLVLCLCPVVWRPDGKCISFYWCKLLLAMRRFVS